MTENNEDQMPEAKPRRASFASQLQAFDFRGDAIDTALRKLLAKVLLPKEAQQIDRAMEDFAKRYHECNPDLADSPDAIYAVAFSILLLHTDAHNKNVRQKMTKDVFIMRTRIIDGGEKVPADVLDIMYDNIVSTEFTYAETDQHDNAKMPEKSATTSWFGRLGRSESSSSLNSTEDLVHKLTQLMPPDNPYSFKRSLKSINIAEANSAFHNARPLLLGGVRGKNVGSAHSNQHTHTIRVAKAGILDRKYDLLPGGRKATARGWRPFGVILSGTQMIFFADIVSFESWIVNEARRSAGSTPPASPSFASSIVSNNHATVNSMSSVYSNSSLSPSLVPVPSISSSFSSSQLRPVQIISLSEAVCIYDETYTKYPHVFRLLTGDGQQFLMHAKDDAEVDDWMSKINYAATVKTTGIKLRISHHARHADKTRREEKAKAKISELSRKIAEMERLLENDLRLQRNLMVLVPLQKSTRERLLYFAELTGKKIQAKRIELQRLECYKSYLEASLYTDGARKMSAPLLSRMVVPTASRSATVPVITKVDTDKASDASTINDDGNTKHQSNISSASEPKKLDDNNSKSRRSSCPQIPPFPFITEHKNPEQDNNSKDSHREPSMENDTWVRRRSTSNPIKSIPSLTSTSEVVKKEEQNRRERSSSEASSLRDEDDEVTIVMNHSEEDLKSSCE